MVNDYVPFYFSPLTGFTFTISRGNVDLRDPANTVLGKASDDERIFFVCAVEAFANTNLQYCFSDLALNTAAPMPKLEASIANLETHVAWPMFDDVPMKAQIPEIEYGGVCEYFASRASPQKYQNRSKQRMAEFLVKDAVPLSLVDCIVTKDQGMKHQLQLLMDASQWNIPILDKPGCFF
ncbi:hypothetical protein HMP06_1385 [Sphingomonas sp. HMP6]|nr:hypothetical protein HMP06_1385 [Sphingomonas sp. HMP6]